MSRARQGKRVIVVVLLLASLGLLIWGILPSNRASKKVPVSPIEFIVPTPEAFFQMNTAVA
jgi:hypothetical protein